MVLFLFNTVICVFLLLGLCILIVRLPWPKFSRAFSSVVRQMPGYNSPRWGTDRTVPEFCVVLYIVCFVLSCVLFVCKCVLYYCHRVATQLQLTNISYQTFQKNHSLIFTAVSTTGHIASCYICFSFIHYKKGFMFIHIIWFRYFDCIDICKVRSGWNEVRLRGTLPPLSSLDHLSCVLLTVLEPTEAEFTLFQEGQR